MKFAIIVVVLALALGTQSGLVTLPYAAAPLSYTAVSGPGYYTAAPGSVAVHAPVVSTYSAPLVSTYAAAPVVSTYAAHTVAAPVVAAPAVVAAEGSYVAQTRGAVHVAPLPGHATSAASVNLQPAPGTL